jgi:DNA replication initiation complex subunit (GINS family)
MSIYLGGLDAYDPVSFGDDVEYLIQKAIKEVALKDLFDTESDFYDNLIQEIKDLLHSFCHDIADEAWDQGEESGRESGYESGYESASDEMYSQGYVDDLEETISDLRSEVSSCEESRDELEEELQEARSSSVSVDVEEIRRAVKADLLAEMTPDDDYYYED